MLTLSDYIIYSNFFEECTLSLELNEWLLENAWARKVWKTLFYNVEVRLKKFQKWYDSQYWKETSHVSDIANEMS